MSAPPLAARRGTRPRRALTWAGIVVVLIVAGTIGALLASSLQWSGRERLDPESAGPDGARALARILAQHGVDVQVVRDREDAYEALATAPATLVLPDSAYLSDETFLGLADAAADVVVMEPRSRGIRLLFDGRVDGYGDDAPVPPDCALPAARRAGPIAVGAAFGADAAGCYPVGDEYGLVWAERPAGRAVAVDGTVLFTNDRLATGGNAALAVNLLGERGRVVWFVPALTDSDGADAATLGELTPPWVSPAIVLLICAAAGTILWRGRRFGPLVRERLPVTVRGSETTRGRAHLYAESRDVAHAAAVLRRGATVRLGRMLGLPATADATAVADAVAARLGRADGDVHGILHLDRPRTDRDLVILARRLNDLETALTSALRPGKETR